VIRRYSSFLRQVNLWGFERVGKGPELNYRYHEDFSRDDICACSRMRRVAVKNIGGWADSSSSSQSFPPISGYAVPSMSTNAVACHDMSFPRVPSSAVYGMNYYSAQEPLLRELKLPMMSSQQCHHLGHLDAKPAAKIPAQMTPQQTGGLSQQKSEAKSQQTTARPSIRDIVEYALHSYQRERQLGLKLH